VKDETRSSRLLTAGILVTCLATAGAMIADVFVPTPAPWLAIVPVYCLAAFVVSHSFVFLGARRAIWFLAVATILPFVTQFISTNLVAVSASQWLARTDDPTLSTGLLLPGQVPLNAIVTWYGLLYIVFTSSVLLLRARASDHSSFASVPLLGALLATLWRLASGPAAVGRSTPAPADNGLFQQIPLASFVGWFVIAMFVLLFFQIVEPGAVDVDQFAESEPRLAPTSAMMYGACLLHASAVCLRTNATGAGWLGVVVFLLFTLAVASSSTKPATPLRQAATAGT